MRRTRLGLATGALLAGALVLPPSASISAHDSHNRTTFSATLKSFNEVPTLSTDGKGSFKARLNRDGDELKYSLTYSGLTSTVAQAHIHLGKTRLNGGIMVWLCQGTSRDPQNDPANPTPECPAPGETVEGTINAARVLTVGTTGIVAGEFDEFIRALKEEAGYANVHTATYPGGEIRGQVQDQD